MSATPRIKTLKEFGSELAQAVAVLLAAGTPRPGWNTKQAAWRHDTTTQNMVLFVLTKLAGSVSTTNAMLALAERGFWFESAILSRAVHDANLSIAFILPASETDWPSPKQKEALDEFFKETWDDPERPFEEPRQRSQIPIKDLKTGLAKFQNDSSEMNPHDSGQTALQMMRFLSDYTHMAYPRLMELLEAVYGYRLNGEQPSSSAFGPAGAAGTLNYCVSTAEATAIFMAGISRGAVDLATTKGDTTAAQRLSTKAEAIAAAQTTLTSLFARVEAVTTHTGVSARKTLQDFKGRKGSPNQASDATSESALGVGSEAHQG